MQQQYLGPISPSMMFSVRSHSTSSYYFRQAHERELVHALPTF